MTRIHIQYVNRRHFLSCYQVYYGTASTIVGIVIGSVVLIGILIMGYLVCCTGSGKCHMCRPLPPIRRHSDDNGDQNVTSGVETSRWRQNNNVNDYSIRPPPPSYEQCMEN